MAKRNSYPGFPVDKVRLKFKDASKDKPHFVGSETMDPHGFFSIDWAKLAIEANPLFILDDPRYPKGLDAGIIEIEDVTA